MAIDFRGLRHGYHCVKLNAIQQKYVTEEYIKKLTAFEILQSLILYCKCFECLKSSDGFCANLKSSESFFQKTTLNGTRTNKTHAGLLIVTDVGIFPGHPARQVPRATRSINGQVPDVSPVLRLLPQRRGKKRWSSWTNRGLVQLKQKLKVKCFAEKHKFIRAVITVEPAVNYSWF